MLFFRHTSSVILLLSSNLWLGQSLHKFLILVAFRLIFTRQCCNKNTINNFLFNNALKSSEWRDNKYNMWWSFSINQVAQVTSIGASAGMINIRLEKVGRRPGTPRSAEEVTSPPHEPSARLHARHGARLITMPHMYSPPCADKL